jgi:hypothetical protein
MFHVLAGTGTDCKGGAQSEDEINPPVPPRWDKITSQSAYCE